MNVIEPSEFVTGPATSETWGVVNCASAATRAASQSGSARARAEDLQVEMDFILGNVLIL